MKFLNSRLEVIVSRITPVDLNDSVQQSTGTESNYKCLLELKVGDKPLLLSTGSSPESQQYCGELYHVLFFVLKGFHPLLPPPPSIAWSLPLLTAYNSGLFMKGIFEREAVYQGVQEEIRPWVWKNLCEALLKGSVVLSKDDIQTLVSTISSIPDSIEEDIQKICSEESIREGVRLLSRYVIATQISLVMHSDSP